MLKLFEAKTEKDFKLAGTLFLEYVDFLKERFYKYVDQQWATGHWQYLEKEAKTLPGSYAHPQGCILLAEYKGQIAGCIALKELDDGICQMKRLYVRPQFRNLGIGNKLVEGIIEKGRESGYYCMRLNTNRLLDSALKLYSSLGFKEIEPFEQPYTETSVFMELKLV
jgi:ribosomal protein S18 acetylase RimI-like enzyme